MKVILNQSACIGCGACGSICEDVFNNDNGGISELKKEIVNDEEEIKLVEEAVEACPTAAISLVDEDDENEGAE